MQSSAIAVILASYSSLMRMENSMINLVWWAKKTCMARKYLELYGLPFSSIRQGKSSENGGMWRQRGMQRRYFVKFNSIDFMEWLSHQQRKDLSLEATIHIIELCSDNIGRTHTSIQERILEQYPGLLKNPYIRSSNGLITLLIMLAKSWTFRILWKHSDDTTPTIASPFDPKTFQNFVNLWRFSQACYILELCWVQAYNEDIELPRITQRMNDIFSRTHGYKARLFHLIWPEDLRVYYQSIPDTWRHHKHSAPIFPEVVH